MKKVLIIFLMTAILSSSMPRMSHASDGGDILSAVGGTLATLLFAAAGEEMGFFILAYAMTPVVVPFYVIPNDKTYYVGVEPVFNSINLGYDFNGTDAVWGLRGSGAAISIGASAAPEDDPDDIFRARIEFEFVYNSFNGTELDKDDIGLELLNYQQFIALYNAYYDLTYEDIFTFSFKLGLGAIHQKFDLKSASTLEPEHISETLFAISPGIDLYFIINSHHSVGLTANGLFGFRSSSDLAGYNLAVGYKYWF
ncbi:MAG: hypothetical protein LBV04_04385 [Deferribacteraceae bacterium]|nr:hypothetical protein [Deferribacteraceae bacterium]